MTEQPSMFSAQLPVKNNCLKTLVVVGGFVHSQKSPSAPALHAKALMSSHTQTHTQKKTTPDKNLSTTWKKKKSPKQHPIYPLHPHLYILIQHLLICVTFGVWRDQWHLKNVRGEWLWAEVTGCDNFCLADKHRQNHSSFLFSITMNYALGCQRSFMCPYSLWGPVLSHHPQSGVMHLLIRDTEMQQNGLGREKLFVRSCRIMWCPERVDFIKK